MEIKKGTVVALTGEGTNIRRRVVTRPKVYSEKGGEGALFAMAAMGYPGTSEVIGGVPGTRVMRDKEYQRYMARQG